MKRSDLFREYARVIDMCEGTEVHPFACVRVRGTGYVSRLGTPPTFVEDPEHYEFALAILEGKPVFKGDEVYRKTTGSPHIVQGIINTEEFFNTLTWAKPRTFTLNGEVLPRPWSGKGGFDWSFTAGGRAFYFNTEEKRDQVLNAVLRVLIDAENS